MEPWGLTTGPKKTPHPLGCQEHCKCGVSAPAIFTVMPNSPTPHPSHSPHNGAAEPPTLPATMSAHVGWQQWRGGGGGWCRMGRPAAGWDSYWAFERWARSSHLPNSSIMPHKRTQIKRTHSCLRSHYHIQALSSLFSPSLSLCEPKPGEKRGPEFRLSLALGGHGSARRKRQVVFWLTSLGINLCFGQNDGQPEGLYGVGSREGGGRRRVSKNVQGEIKRENGRHVNPHCSPLFLSCSSHSIELKCITVTL